MGNTARKSGKCHIISQGKAGNNQKLKKLGGQGIGHQPGEDELTPKTEAQYVAEQNTGFDRLRASFIDYFGIVKRHPCCALWALEPKKPRQLCWDNLV